MAIAKRSWQTFKNLRWLLLILLALTLPREGVQAQSANPLRIQFKQGAHSAALAGNLRGRQQMIYVVAAKKDQRMTLNLESASAEALTLRVKNPENIQVGIDQNGTNSWSGALPETGDYTIFVIRGSDAGASYYSLTVSIR